MARTNFFQVIARGAIAVTALAAVHSACESFPSPVAGEVFPGKPIPFEPAATETWDGGAFTTDGAPPAETPMACGDSQYRDPWTPGDPIDVETQAATTATAYWEQMPLTNLADQMRGTTPDNGSNYFDIFRTPNDPQFQVRGFLFRDGPRGLCLAAQAPNNQVYSTAFPVPEARAAAFDMDLEEQIGEAIGDEVLASGNTMILAPVVNLLRHPAWGRAQETYGEDSYVNGKIGSAFVVGSQKYVPACVKHYAAYNIEEGRSFNNSIMDEQTLREEYVRHFGAVIEDTGVACVMASYNLVNGVKATLNGHLLNDILRGDFHYGGFVLTDWWAMPPGGAPATTDYLQQQAINGVNAGLDMELPWAYNYQQIEAVAGLNGRLTLGQIQTSAARILQQKFRFNVGDMNSQTIGLQAPTTTLTPADSIAGNQKHIDLALKTALESMVLLKNDQNTLPIPSTVKKIAVIGATVPYKVVSEKNPNSTLNFATDVRLGDLGSSRVFSDPVTSVGPFAGIQAAAQQIGAQVYSGQSAADVQPGTDYIVAVVGLTPQDEGEEYTGAADRSTFALDGKQPAPIQDPMVMGLTQLGKPLVVVVEAGSVIDMSQWLPNVPAVVMAWYPGMVGGTALGRLLFAQNGANFGGKLPFTWPKQWTDEPRFSGTDQSSTDTVMDYNVGYQWFDNKQITPLYYFGRGLSYTTFTYSNLFVPCTTTTKNSVVYVTADVTNAGTVAGDETAFLFVSYPNHPERRHQKDLKGFYRVSLNPGETKRVTFPVRVNDLKYWDNNFVATPDNVNGGWRDPVGDFQVQVGPSADNLPLVQTFTVQPSAADGGM